MWWQHPSSFFEPQKSRLAYVDKMLDIYKKAYPDAICGDLQGLAHGVAHALRAIEPSAGELGDIGKSSVEASVALNSTCSWPNR